MMESKEQRLETWTQGNLEMSRRMIDGAYDALAKEDIPTVIYGAYQGFFYGMKAMLCQDGEYPDKHTETFERFTNRYQTMFPRRFFRNIRKGLAIHLLSAYEHPDACPKERALDMLRQAEDFYARAADLIQKRETSPHWMKAREAMRNANLYSSPFTRPFGSQTVQMQEDSLFVWGDILVKGYYSESGRKIVTPEEARCHRDLAMVTRFWNDNRLEPLSYEDYEAEINGENSSERRYDPKHNWYVFDGGYEWFSLPRDFTLPEEIIGVGPNAFQLAEFRSITIPEGVAILDAEAFYHCPCLEEVRLPSTLREIRSWCFGKCEKLRTIVMPEQIDYYEHSPFAECPSLADEQGFIIFNKRLFEYFPREENETCVVIPEGVEQIMAFAFSGLTSLRTLVLPESLREVEDCAFRGCTGLADENGFVIVKNKLLDYCGDSPVLHLPETVRCIASFSFFFGKSFSLREIHLPSALEEIHERSMVEPDNDALCIFVPPSIPFYKLRDMLREARGDFASFSPAIAAPHLYPGGQYARQLAVGYAVAYQADHRKGPHHEKYVSYFQAHLESMRRKPFFQEEIRGFIESECSAREN